MACINVASVGTWQSYESLRKLRSPLKMTRSLSEMYWKRSGASLLRSQNEKPVLQKGWAGGQLRIAAFQLTLVLPLALALVLLPPAAHGAKRFDLIVASLVEKVSVDGRVEKPSC
jgi:hypothetical protein